MTLLPVVAIVGRPNVGKSTLFNRLTKSREALVSDFPGMTRDRKYGQAQFENHRFIIVDTAGFADHQQSDLDKLAYSQTLQALKEADKIIFLVDGLAGLMTEDKDIANVIRALGKPIFLTVNKTEGKEDSIIISDFFELGLGTPYPISAAHGAGITELLISVFPTTTQESVDENEIPPEGIKLAIVGRPNVGKSTLTNRMLGEERVIVYDQPGTTRDSIFIPLTRFDQRYVLIDTAGIRRRGKIFESTEKFSVIKTLKAVEAANVVLFVMDAREGVTEQDLKLLGFVLDAGKALVIAINKWDGMSADEKSAALTSMDRRLTFLSFVRIHKISALHGTGVGNLFDSIQEAFNSANRKLATPKLTELLIKAVESHSPPLVQGRRIKLRYAHLGGHNPPVIVIHGNQVSSLPSAYKRYLANVYQERLELWGTPIRIELKSSENPYKNRKNVLTDRQRRKKQRVIRNKK